MMEKRTALVRPTIHRVGVMVALLATSSCNASGPPTRAAEPAVADSGVDALPSQFTDQPRAQPSARPNAKRSAKAGARPDDRPVPPAPPKVLPSPWQPPAVVDPVRPEVGNETPG
jgi:hypothetical protein